MNWGMLLALFGAGLAVTTNCFGSSKGVGMVAEASSPVIAEDSSKFSKHRRSGFRSVSGSRSSDRCKPHLQETSGFR